MPSSRHAHAQNQLTAPRTRSGRTLAGRARWRWSSRIAFLAMLGIAGCTLVSASISLSNEFTQVLSEEFRAAAGTVLAGCALWQMLILRQIYARRDRLKAFTLGLVSPFWQWLILALAGSYLIALLLGPGARAQNTFAALAVLSYTFLLHRYTQRASRGELAERGLNTPRFSLRQAAAWGICGLIVIVCGAEICLRVVDVWSDQPTPVANFVRRATLPPGLEYRGRTSNNLGFWDDEFRLAAAGNTQRVVVLGDELTLSGNAETNFVSLLEHRLSGTDVQHFGVAGTGPREYGVVLTAEAAKFRPQLVLACVNLANDITDPPQLPGVFEWRGLRLYEWSLRRWQPELLQPVAARETTLNEVDANRSQSSGPDYEALLTAAERDLTVCRTPMPEETRDQWEQTFGSLARLQEACSRLECELVVVMMPSRAQVDGALRANAQRRLGLTADQLDVGLPQRRLLDFAEESGLVLLDLTPLFSQEGCQNYRRHAPDWTAETHARIADYLVPALSARLRTLPQSVAWK